MRLVVDTNIFLVFQVDTNIVLVLWWTPTYSLCCACGWWWTPTYSLDTNIFLVFQSNLQRFWDDFEREHSASAKIFIPQVVDMTKCMPRLLRKEREVTP